MVFLLPDRLTQAVFVYPSEETNFLIISRYKNILTTTIFFLSVAVIVQLSIHPQGTGISKRILKCGDRSNPCRIRNRKDFEKFRDKVNKGKSFKGRYFLQTKDIDLQNVEWMPIGIFGSKKYFEGTYDGGGHVIKNLNISSQYPHKPANVGLFGTLNGIVKNLGIESGTVAGDSVGGIVSHAGGANAAVINCYNKANVTGKSRAGGIADNFSKGTIINCVNEGKVDAPVRGEIISYNAANIIAVHSEKTDFPKTFTGSYIEYNSAKEKIRDKLNDGLSHLISEKVIDRSSVKKWR